MRISFFGKISDPIGKTTDIAVPASGLCVSDIRQEIAEACQTELILDQTIRAAVNDKIVMEDHRVMPGDDLMFMSVLSGG
ncbi:MAG: MoaD/ThiS family protein [Alphaproteobacteria bacterium]|nr:MoaD/ThiS family protein [Alphaproteobacteria bacterium]